MYSPRARPITGSPPSSPFGQKLGAKADVMKKDQQNKRELPRGRTEEV